MPQIPAYICYIDDSGDANLRIFSALITPLDSWRATFALVKEFRQKLKAHYGVYMRTELHGTTFVRGKGHVSDRILTKYQRRYIFNSALKFIAGLPQTFLINACDSRKKEERIYERFLLRIHNTMNARGSKAILISDEGKDYTSLLRKMGVHNPVHSMFATWPDGRTTRNITVDNLIEDLIFRKSHRSYFIQLADFCAYSLFCSEAKLPLHTKYGLDKSFDALIPICTPFCFYKDPRKLGIIRA